MKPTFAPVTVPTLRAQIADRIREAILQGWLKAGEKVVERKLAGEFGASLTAIREAVITLETEGFITKRPNAATYITALTATDVDQIFEVRRLLEPHAIARAAVQATGEDVSRLNKIYTGMLNAAKNRNLKLYVERDFSLHSTIWVIAGNEFLQTALKRLTLRLFSFSVIRFSTDGAFDLLADAQSHKPLLDAIQRHDPKGASSYMAKSLDAWQSEVRDFMTTESEAVEGLQIVPKARRKKAQGAGRAN